MRAQLVKLAHSVTVGRMVVGLKPVDKPIPLAARLQQRRQHPLPYSEWMTVLNLHVQANTARLANGNPRRFGHSTRIPWKHGVEPQTVAELITFGLV